MTSTSYSCLVEEEIFLHLSSQTIFLYFSLLDLVRTHSLQICITLFARESEGSFQYGNYRREADDLRAVVQHFQGEKRTVAALVGHSKGT